MPSRVVEGYIYIIQAPIKQMLSIGAFIFLEKREKTAE